MPNQTKTWCSLRSKGDGWKDRKCCRTAQPASWFSLFPAVLFLRLDFPRSCGVPGAGHPLVPESSGFCLIKSAVVKEKRTGLWKSRTLRELMVPSIKSLIWKYLWQVTCNKGQITKKIGRRELLWILGFPFLTAVCYFGPKLKKPGLRGYSQVSHFQLRKKKAFLGI